VGARLKQAYLVVLALQQLVEPVRLALEHLYLVVLALQQLVEPVRLALNRQRNPIRMRWCRGLVCAASALVQAMSGWRRMVRARVLYVLPSLCVVRRMFRFGSCMALYAVLLHVARCTLVALTSVSRAEEEPQA
jgi:hypothetical protein